MADEQDGLLQFWLEQRAQARQTENQRATVTNIVLIVAPAYVGLVVQQGVTDRSTFAVSLGLTMLGLYGAVASMKYRERYGLHLHKAELMRRRFDALHPGIGLEADNQAARERHITKHPWLHRVSLHYIWTAFHLGIAVTGVVLTAVIALSSAR
ncbi:hypothetical protein ACFWBR_30065 [Streptomyces sp. NPDC060006]|uniref:hypothetical protein n=1 Tax=unclassified Streptomyces TaxID=2593676 RepID=UPI0036ADDF60